MSRDITFINRGMWRENFENVFGFDCVRKGIFGNEAIIREEVIGKVSNLNSKLANVDKITIEIIKNVDIEFDWIWKLCNNVSVEV